MRIHRACAGHLPPALRSRLPATTSGRSPRIPQLAPARTRLPVAGRPIDRKSCINTSWGDRATKKRGGGRPEAGSRGGPPGIERATAVIRTRGLGQLSTNSSPIELAGRPTLQGPQRSPKRAPRPRQPARNSLRSPAAGCLLLRPSCHFCLPHCHPLWPDAETETQGT